MFSESPQKDGFNAETAENGMEAIRLLDKEKYDLVISDYNMPQMDGGKLLDYIATHYPLLTVILMSGENLVGKVGPGYTAILQKPLKSDDLIAACQLFA